MPSVYLSIGSNVDRRHNVKSCITSLKAIFGNLRMSPVYESDSVGFEGDNFLRTVVWEFPNYQKAIECHDSKDYQKGWALAKDTTVRHMQVVEGFSTE